MFKKILIIAILICLIGGFTFAAKPTEITYPDVPGAITPVTIKTALPEYVRYIFNFFVFISGLICFGVLIYAGVIYLTSAGNPGKQKEATSRIGSAFLGIIIIFGSYLISTTINPQLVIPYIGIKPVGGVTLGSSGCEGNEPGGETKTLSRDTANFGLLADGSGPFIAQSIKFASPPGALEITLYDSENFQGNQLQINSDIRDCYNAGTKKSIKFSWQVAGVYLCTETYDSDGKCQGEKAYLGADTGLLTPEFNDQVKAIKLRPAFETIGPGSIDETKCLQTYAGKWWTKNGEGFCTYPIQYFGAVLHEHANFSGQCEMFQGTTYANVINLSESKTIGENIASSITVFAEHSGLGVLSGGVWFCKHNDPAPQDLNDPEKCLGPYQQERKEKMPDGWDNEVTSIVIQGSYMAILFEHGGADAYKGVCEVFTENSMGRSNLRSRPIGRCDCIFGNWGCADCLSSFIIVPTQK